jgi:hypothetical protein
LSFLGCTSFEKGNKLTVALWYACPPTVSSKGQTIKETPYILDMITTIVVIMARIGGVAEVLVTVLDEFNSSSSAPT